MPVAPAVVGIPPRPAPRRLPPPSRARRVPDAGALARHRVAVGVAKRLLPLAAVLLLATVALWPEIEGAEERGRVAFKRVAQVRPDAMRIVEPRYQGLDEQNRPFTVTASTATQLGDTSRVALDRPRADMTLSDGAWVYVEARDGLYDRGRNTLDLEGRVTLHHDDGTQIVTARAALDLAAGRGSGDDPVAAQGPFGTLTAEGFRLSDRGQIVVFTGRARAVLEGSR